MGGRARSGRLTLWERVAYRVRLVGMHMYGPAQLGDAEDPVVRLKRDHAARVAASRR